MKGVNKRIIEIEEPDNEYIEKVQVFLRKDGKVKLAQGREEAQKYASGIVCTKPNMPIKIDYLKYLLAGAGIIGAIALILVIFM